MEILKRCSTIPEMLEICKEAKRGNFDRDRLLRLLDHEDYQVEFARYKRLSREEYVEFFSNFCAGKEVGSKFAGQHINYTYLFDHLEEYEEEYAKLVNFTDEQLIEQVEKAQRGLPTGFTFDKLHFLFTISIGPSFGWPFEHCSHFDFIQLVRDYNIDAFKSTLAHEIHHVGISAFFEKMTHYAELSPEEILYISFSGEGLAVKYCNNAVGHLSKAINEHEEKNIGLDAFSWEYLNNDFDNTFKVFQDQLQQIRSGQVQTHDEIGNWVVSYWNNPFLEGQEPTEIPKLLQSRQYSFGNEIWGVIHDVFGKDKVYEVLHDPTTFRGVYNEAVKRIGKEQYQI